jgi:predicted lipoprotein with Yx(FWY)xxD motif
MTAVSATGSATMLTNAAGVRTYTFTVGTTSGMTAGTYTSIIDFTSLTAAAATKATPTYKLTTGGDQTTNADILKSIVALIASINKQIQALQKLILKR